MMKKLNFLSILACFYIVGNFSVEANSPIQVCISSRQCFSIGAGLGICTSGQCPVEKLSPSEGCSLAADPESYGACMATSNLRKK